MEIRPSKILSIRRTGKTEPTYDIQVKTNHNFFANGLLVHNCLLYQEQLQFIYNKLCGIPLDETDNVRKAFTKKENNEEAKIKAKQERLILREDFIRLSKEHSGLELAAANKFFDMMSELVAYSFNKCLHKETLVETQNGPKYIKDVIPGTDLVNSKNGFVSVVNKFNNGKKKLYKFKTKQGKTLICTLDHKIETPEGMKTLEEISLRKSLSVCTTVLPDYIESIEYFGEEETYDLEVDHADHTFYANDISVSNSHAISYSIATFQCCWFLTYYPDEWVTSYLDYSATEKGKVAGKEDPKTSAMREIQKLGYKIFKPDINLSGDGYAMHPTEKKIIVPGITSIKGIGTVAIQELNANRPYKTVKDLLVHESGAWRHSKFNKRSLESMIKLEGLESMGIVGADKQIKNYQQLKNIVIGHHDELKRIASRKKNNDITPRLLELIEAEKDTPDWTRDEKIDHWLELAGTVDMSLILTEEHWKIIQRFDLKSIDEVPELSEEDGVEEIKNQFVWFIVRSVAAKTSSTGKPFLEIKANGDRFVDINIKLWNCQKAKEIVDKKLIKKNTVMSGVVSRHAKFGFSSYYNKIAPLLEAAGFGESDTPIG